MTIPVLTTDKSPDEVEFIPERSYAFIDWLDRTYPPRCIGPKESLESAHRYAKSTAEHASIPLFALTVCSRLKFQRNEPMTRKVYTYKRMTFRVTDEDAAALSVILNHCRTTDRWAGRTVAIRTALRIASDALRVTQVAIR